MEGGGEGLYAVRDIEKDEIVAFYNGVGSQGGSAVDVYVNFPFLGAVAIQTWGEGRLGNFCVQNICECRSHQRGADRPARGPHIHGELLCYVRAQDEPQL